MARLFSTDFSHPIIATNLIETHIAMSNNYDLKVLQNNALRLFKRYHLLDRIRVDQLHSECRIIGLEQRRRKQLLRLMYLHSRFEVNMKKPLRITRAVSKLVFKTASKCTTKYLNSPFYKGTLLWDKLDKDLQRVNNVKQFLRELNKLYPVYQEMWEISYNICCI